MNSPTLKHSNKASAGKAVSLKPTAMNLLSEHQSGLPIWIRSPKQGLDFYTGFSRAKLYEGAASGHFRSVSIREPGQTKGTRLFHLGSILEYINRCEAVQEVAK